jgi:HK97 family phage major capsid protein
MKETTFTNNAGVKGEGVAYDEAALAVAQTTVTMNRLGVYIPVTDDQLEDEPAANAYIDRRLRDMVRIKMEAQILNGNGTEPQWEGILGLSGIQTLDSTSYDSKFDALHLAIMNVMRSDATTYGGGMANLIAMAPADWQDFATTRTADGVYIYGSVVDAVTRRAWGLPVIVNFTITAGTALVLDTRYFPIGIRRDMKLERTNSHGELFIAGTQVIRADIKGNVIPIRDAAAVKVINI